MHLFEQPDFLPFLRGQEETRGAEMSLEIRFYFSFLNIKRISGVEAMENFVFPDLMKTKLMKMNELMSIFCPLELC